MDFYFTNRQFELLEIISTSNSTEIVLADEEDKLSVENGNRTLKGTIYFDNEQSKQVKECGELGNYILYHDPKKKKDVWMTIVEKDHRPKSGRHEFVAEDAGLDLLNELLGPFKADKAYPISYYIEKFTFDSGFELGFNEIPNLTRKLEWESEDTTALARLVSVATQFDNAEIDFSFDVEGTTVLKKYINIYKKRGKDNGETYYVNVDIDEIAVKGDIYDLGTAIKAIGGTPEGKNSPINLIGYKWTDPDGRYELDSKTGILKDKVNGAKWSRLLPGQANPHGAYILRRKTYETTDQKTLLDNTLRELKKISEPAVNYEVENIRLSDEVDVGDTINLVDENEEVYLSARLLETTEQYSTDTVAAVLGDYLIKESGISQKLTELANSLQDQANRKLYDVKLEATSTTLINENSSVKITAKVYDGSLDVSTNFSEYKWSRMDPAGAIDPNWSNITNTVTIKADDQPLWTYICEVSKLTEDSSSYVIGADRVTIVNLADERVGKPVQGEDGKNSYFHTGYANNANGKDFSTSDATGRSWIGTYSDFEPLDSNDYTKYTWQVLRGIKSTKDTYARSTSGTTIPQTGWQETIPTVPAGEYLWKKTETTYTDDTKDSTYINAKMGADGKPGSTGVGIKSNDIEYQVSDSGTATPQGAWSKTIPSVKPNQYLWTRTKLTYTDDSYSYSYSVGRMGADGSDAQLLYLTATAETMNFDAEDNPKTTQTITISAKLQNVTGTATFKAVPYIGNTAQSAINLDGSGNDRTLTSSQWTNKSWTMIVITATLNGLTDTLSITKVNDGKEGEPGPPGDDGSPTYLHIAYANDLNGTDFSTTDATNRIYIGTYSDQEELGSSDYRKYVWLKVKGEPGLQGNPTGIVESDNIPVEIYEGMLWKCTGEVSGFVQNAIYRWDGTKWELFIFMAVNINTESLSALSANLGNITSGNITGATINGSEFINDYTATTTGGEDITGSTIIDQGYIQSRYRYTVAGDNGQYKAGPDSTLIYRYDDDGFITQSSTEDTDSLLKTTISQSGSTWTKKENAIGVYADFAALTSDSSSKDGPWTLKSGVWLSPESLSMQSEFYGIPSTYINAVDVYNIRNAGERLWGGVVWFLSASQTITPSKKLSDCFNGWVVEWQGYSNGAATGGDYTYSYIPKIHARYNNGKVMSVLVVGHGGGIFRKILYVSDTTITGHANNAAAPANTAVVSNVYTY